MGKIANVENAQASMLKTASHQALKQSIEKAKPTQKAAPPQRKRKTASSDS